MNDPREEWPRSDLYVDAPLSRNAVRISRVGAILYGLAVGAIALYFAPKSLEPAIWLFQEYAGDTVALAVTGWLIATLGPIVLSVSVWMMARRLKARWLLHLLFIPTAIAIGTLGASLFFDGVKASGANMPEVFALELAAMFLLLTLLVHVAALILEGYKKIKHLANGS